MFRGYGSLRENRRSVGQNRQISEMSGKFCDFAGQYVRRKIYPEKCPDSVFWLLGLQLMKIVHISCIFSIKFAVVTERGKTSIQTEQSFYFCPAVFFSVRQKFSVCRTAVRQHLRRFCEDWYGDVHVMIVSS